MISNSIPCKISYSSHQSYTPTLQQYTTRTDAMAQNIIPMLWTCMTSGPRPGEAEHVLFLILDEIEDALDLWSLMEAQPAMAGFLLWTYWMSQCWTEYFGIINNADAVESWHAVQRRQLERDTARTRIQQEVIAVEEADGAAAGRSRRANLIQIDLEEMAQKLVWTLTQRRLIMRLQREPTARAFMGRSRATMTASQRWNRDLAWDIRRQLRRDADKLQVAMAVEERNLKLYTDALTADSAPAPTLPTIPALPRPIASNETILNPETGLPDLEPIESLICVDADHALRVLLRLGLFNPLGYSHHGMTWLAMAIIKDSHRVARYILSHYTPAALARHTELPAVIEPGNDPLIDNHVVALARHKWRRSFNEAWPRFFSAFPPGAPPNLAASFLTSLDQENLLWMVPGKIAEELRTCGVDLSTVTPSAVAGFHFFGGTPWHIAARNTDPSFFDWLARQGNMRAEINNLDDIGRTPLEIAYKGRASGALGGGHLNNLVAAERLIHHGAHFYAFAKDILLELPDFPRSNRWLNMFFRSSGARMAEYPWIHDVLVGLDTMLRRNGAASRRHLMARAKNLIRWLRDGNGVAKASLTLERWDNKKPVAVAEELGLYSLMYLLQERKTATNGRADRTQYGLRNRVRKHYKD
ncbi:hypothetical protein BDW74DRAFT_161957 [Aspergillus multicolor]|uniref:uncharacterized protein n=1 Tax=Aspergillus multicolor TaxID=41759 RepID=UPI003CCDFC7E